LLQDAKNSALRNQNNPLIGPEWPHPDYSKYIKKEPGVELNSFNQPAAVTAAAPEAEDEAPVQAVTNETGQDRNIQLLPPRLSAVLMQVNNQVSMS
jgi:hypothetical protein